MEKPRLLNVIRQQRHHRNTYKDEYIEHEIIPSFITKVDFEDFPNHHAGTIMMDVFLEQVLTKDTYQRLVTQSQHTNWLEHHSEKHLSILSSLSDGCKTTFNATSSSSTTSAWMRALPTTNRAKLTDFQTQRSLHYRLATGTTSEWMDSIIQKKLFERGDENYASSSSSSCSRMPPVNSELRLQGLIDVHHSGVCIVCKNRRQQHHYSCCQLSQGNRTSRHHLIKRSLAAEIVKNPLLKVKIEDTEIKNLDAFDLDDEGKVHKNCGKVPDLTITCLDPPDIQSPLEIKLLGPRTDRHIIQFCLDVTVAETHALTKMSLKDVENHKIKKYTGFKETQGLVVLPFAISSSSELGPITSDVLKFLNSLNPQNSSDLTGGRDQHDITWTWETPQARSSKAAAKRFVDNNCFHVPNVLRTI